MLAEMASLHMCRPTTYQNVLFMQDETDGYKQMKHTDSRLLN